MGLLLVLVGLDNVPVLTDNELSTVDVQADDSGGSDLFGFGPAWPDGIIIVIDDIAPATAAQGVVCLFLDDDISTFELHLTAALGGGISLSFGKVMYMPDFPSIIP
uniref:Uncharacterized protein n=1 Tax=Oryza barthii TaxID=65489 RepID=A0A0D3HCZ9_9ORYZ